MSNPFLAFATTSAFEAIANVSSKVAFPVIKSAAETDASKIPKEWTINGALLIFGALPMFIELLKLIEFFKLSAFFIVTPFFVQTPVNKLTANTFKFPIILVIPVTSNDAGAATPGSGGPIIQVARAMPSWGVNPIKTGPFKTAVPGKTLLEAVKNDVSRAPTMSLSPIFAIDAVAAILCEIL